MDRSGKKRGSLSNYELLKKFRTVHKTYDSDSSLSCDSDGNKSVPEQKDLKRVYAEQNKETEPPAYFSSSHTGTLLKIIGILTLLCHIKIHILVRKTKFRWH